MTERDNVKLDVTSPQRHNAELMYLGLSLRERWRLKKQNTLGLYSLSFWRQVSIAKCIDKSPLSITHFESTQ